MGSITYKSRAESQSKGRQLSRLTNGRLYSMIIRYLGEIPALSGKINVIYYYFDESILGFCRVGKLLKNSY